MKEDTAQPIALESIISEPVQWMLGRYDNWRASIASRCSIVLSADAILLAGQSFLIDNILDHDIKLDSSLVIILSSAIIVSMILTVLSLLYSTVGIANVFKTSRQMMSSKSPDRYLFHPSDVLRNVDNFEDFYNQYSAANTEEIEKAVWSEIWSLISMHHMRYQRLRKAIKFLVISLPFYVISIVVILISLAGS